MEWEENMERVLLELRARSEDIEVRVKAAEERGWAPITEVVEWLKRANSFIQKQSEIERINFYSCCVPLCLLIRFHKPANPIKSEMITEACELLMQGNFTRVSRVSETPVVMESEQQEQMLPSPAEIIRKAKAERMLFSMKYIPLPAMRPAMSIFGFHGMGSIRNTMMLKEGVNDDIQCNNRSIQPMPVMYFRSEELNRLLHHMSSDLLVSIIGIHGMGGVGKTMMLMKVNNEIQRQNIGFSVTMFITVSKYPDAKRIQEEIGERLGLLFDKDHNTVALRAELIHRSLRHERFALLLDDLWEPLDLEGIGIPKPTGDNKCKVLITTRSKDVCKEMNAQEIVELRPLSQYDSWTLFLEKVGVHKNRLVKNFVFSILEKCGGLPPAINLAAFILTGTPHPERIMSALGERIMSALLFSYEVFDTHERLCLFYCSLFPENHSIKEEQLINYWIAEGFCSADSANCIIRKLMTSGVLLQGEDEEDEIRMNGIFRYLASWITSVELTEFLVESGLDLEQLRESLRDFQRISLMHTSIQILNQQAVRAPNLLTLLLSGNQKLKCIHSEFFNFMTGLRVLDLSYTSITELPKSIGGLANLRYLSLSFSSIECLPEEIVQLHKLEQLELEGTLSLTEIPSNLKVPPLHVQAFQVINLYNSNVNWDPVIPECRAFIGVTITNDSTLQQWQNCEQWQNCKHSTCLERLCMRTCEGLKDISLPPLVKDHVKELMIDSVPLSKLNIARGTENEQTFHLEVLHLMNLHRAMINWEADQHMLSSSFHFLKEITIGFCYELKDITWVRKLPSLKQLRLFDCRSIEGVVVANDNQSGPDFPRLELLYLYNLPELTYVCPDALDFPLLKKIHVYGCPYLGKLPLSIKSAPNLKEICGEEEWWHILEWDDDYSKEAFLLYFKEL
ncbi:Disease resistance protein RPS2 [Acorus calamus]|uniref:Disease resistance protein RPS2 n=1 Tax=Acorus calamus TaxID=4465 RepID=A0AAV9CUP1_ACOCL|nr:Disease resistance protein RPS2 [Acorus calamus]